MSRLSHEEINNECPLVPPCCPEPCGCRGYCVDDGSRDELLRNHSRVAVAKAHHRCELSPACRFGTAPCELRSR